MNIFMERVHSFQSHQPQGSLRITAVEEKLSPLYLNIPVHSVTAAWYVMWVVQSSELSLEKGFCFYFSL